MEDVLDSLKDATGIVVPVWYSRSLSTEQIAALFKRTLAGVPVLCRIEHLVAVADGDRRGAQVVEQIQHDLLQQTGETFQLLTLPENRGKGAAIRTGMQHLLHTPSLEFLAVRDNDGDHRLHDLTSIVSAMIGAREETGNQLVMGLGCRPDLHRPLGYLRGELEELVCRMSVDMMAWHAARQGRALQLEYSSACGEWLDIHSGYKAFTRPAAEAVFGSPPETYGMPADAVDRHAVEIVCTLEVYLAGGIVVQTYRSTYNEQPTSTFGEMDRAELFADMIAWPALRLGVPADVVAQFFWNHIQKLSLPTLLPDGKTECQMVLRKALESMGLTGDQASREVFRWPGPRFI